MSEKIVCVRELEFKVLKELKKRHREEYKRILRTLKLKGGKNARIPKNKTKESRSRMEN